MGLQPAPPPAWSPPAALSPPMPSLHTGLVWGMAGAIWSDSTHSAVSRYLLISLFFFQGTSLYWLTIFLQPTFFSGGRGNSYTHLKHHILVSDLGRNEPHGPPIPPPHLSDGTQIRTSLPGAKQSETPTGEWAMPSFQWRFRSVASTKPDSASLRASLDFPHFYF